MAEDAFSRGSMLGLLENYTDQNVVEIAFAIAKVAHNLAHGPRASRNR